MSGLSPGNQLKLLRALETKEFRPVGGRADRRSDFRLVAATNENVASLVDGGRFRRDLLHRLSGVRVVVPPLRDRPDDIPLLVTHFAGVATASNETDLPVDDRAMRLLQAHAWPGNVRELRNVVEAAIALSGGTIGADEVTTLLAPDQAAAPTRARRRQHDRELLALLDRAEWDVDEAARELGVHRATIYRRLKRLNVDVGIPRDTRLPAGESSF
jgi:DNA-binding NtrC family response regulator